MSLVSLKSTYRAVLSKEETVTYVGGAEIFNILVDEHGLVPIYQNRTRQQYLVKSIDSALAARQAAETSRLRE